MTNKNKKTYINGRRNVQEKDGQTGLRKNSVDWRYEEKIVTLTNYVLNIRKKYWLPLLKSILSPAISGPGCLYKYIRLKHGTLLEMVTQK